MEQWLRAYLGTLLIEVPIVSGWMWPQIGIRGIFWGILASTLTHPMLWFVWPQWGPRWAWVGSAEACIWVFEGLLYAVALRKEGKPAWAFGICISVLANASSFLTGLLLQ